jgi:hypothetical protein
MKFRRYAAFDRQIDDLALVRARGIRSLQIRVGCKEMRPRPERSTEGAQRASERRNGSRDERMHWGELGQEPSLTLERRRSAALLDFERFLHALEERAFLDAIPALARERFEQFALALGEFRRYDDMNGHELIAAR